MINPEFKNAVKDFFIGWWETMATSVLEDAGAVFGQLFFTIIPLTFGTLYFIISPEDTLSSPIMLGLAIFLTVMGGINLIMHIIGVILWIFGIRR